MLQLPNFFTFLWKRTAYYYFFGIENLSTSNIGLSYQLGQWSVEQGSCVGTSSKFVPGKVGGGQVGGAWWVELGEPPAAGELAMKKRRRGEVKARSKPFFSPQGQTDRWPDR